MIGLSLEGGGTKGSYQVGAYKAFLECGIEFDGVTGTSIGSFNGAMIASGKFDELENFWLNQDFGKLLGYIEDINADRSHILDDIVAFLAPIKTYVGNNGICIENLKNQISEVLDEELLRNSNKDFGLVTFKVKTRKALTLYIEDIPKGKLLDYVVASCYLPIFKPIKLDDDSYYLDGGFYDKSPSNMLEDKNYKKIYVVALNAIGIERKKHKRAEIIKISPSRSLGSIMDFNRNRMIENINMGYFDTIKVLKKLDGYKFVFEKKPKWIYNLLGRRVSERTLRRIEMFFFTKNKKDLIIKSLEYIMVKEKYSYYDIYNPYKLIKEIKKSKENSIVYKFIKELKIF